MGKAHAEVLLIEDSLEDAELALYALRGTCTHITVDTVMNAAEAESCLTRSYARASARLPQLVVLDLEMPGLDAYGALRQFKSQEETSAVPVVVLTARSDARVIGTCYRLGANSVISKGSSLKDHFSQIQELAKYWLQVNVTAASEDESMRDAEAFRAPQRPEPRHDVSRS
jgi:CheY-like chemotaxis protein